jgi:hypothetical protein
MNQPPPSVQEAIVAADALLPGQPAPENETDPRWQAIIDLAAFLETNPEEIWAFVARWGQSADEDVRGAIATCLLEHLLEHHFELIFPRVRQFARKSHAFAATFASCWKFGQSEQPRNARRFDALQRYCVDLRNEPANG